MNPKALAQTAEKHHYNHYGYKILSQREHELQHGEFRLTSLREEDILLIKDWRNDQIDVLRQKQPLTEADQRHYFETVVKKSFCEETPDIVLFSFLRQKKCIGYGGLVHIDWESKRAEVSFLLNPIFTKLKKNYNEFFQAFLTLIARVAFGLLKFNRLFTETFNIRPYHIKTLENFGFKREGCLREHVYIQEDFKDSLMHGLLRCDWKQGV